MSQSPKTDLGSSPNRSSRWSLKDDNREENKLLKELVSFTSQNLSTEFPNITFYNVLALSLRNWNADRRPREILPRMLQRAASPLRDVRARRRARRRAWRPYLPTRDVWNEFIHLWYAGDVTSLRWTGADDQLEVVEEILGAKFLAN